MSWNRAMIMRISRTHPDLVASLVEHMEYYEDVLPTLWLSDVARWAVEKYVSNDLGTVSGLLVVLDELFAEGTEHDRTLIATGFVESLPNSHHPTGGIRTMLGPQIAQVYRQVNW